MEQNQKPIGVFDSGLGGLTVLRQLRKALPNESFVYLGDTGRVPYGGRSDQTILRYATEAADFLLSKEIKLMVAACGTVSSICGATLGNTLPIPFTGVVEHGAKSAALATRNGKIGLIGTMATIRSGAYEAHLAKLTPKGEAFGVFAKACPMFVPLVENGYTDANDPVATLICEEYLTPLLEEGIDTLILGCTHYPALADVIQKVTGPYVTLIDVGMETARHTAALLADQNLAAPSNHAPKPTDYYVTDPVAPFLPLAQALLGEPVAHTKQITLGK